MPTLIHKPSRIEAAGNKPKLIDEYVGRVTSNTDAVSIAHMRSPGGWQEPGQTPQFDEYTVVLRGVLRVDEQGAARRAFDQAVAVVQPGVTRESLNQALRHTGLFFPIDQVRMQA